MKRKSITIMLVLLGSLLLAGGLTGCSQGKIKFQEGQHVANDAYPETFNTLSYIDPRFELHIQDELYDEETARALVDVVLADVEALFSTFDAGEMPVIYLIRQTPTEEILAGDGAIYCTPDDVTDGSYRSELVKAYLDITEPWKVIGAQGVAFGEEVDQEALITYYSDETNLTTLSLFAAHFVDTLSFNIPQGIIQDTAVSFSDFLLSQYGVDAFLGCTANDGYRQAWLDSLGLSMDYQPAYDLGFLDGAVYTSSEAYPLTITTANRVYSFAGDFAENPGTIMYLLSYYHEGMNTVMAYIAANAPEHAPEILTSWEDSLSIYFRTDIHGSFIDISGKELNIGYVSLRELFNRTFNYLIPEADRELEIWKTFGIADFLFAMAEVPDVSFYSYFLATPDDSWEDDRQFLLMAQDYYFARKAEPDGLKDFDFGLSYEAMAFVTLSNPDLELHNRYFSYSIAQFTGSERKYDPYPGNTLNYPEAYFFTKYLVETYGLDTMLTYCLSNYATLLFENTFGVSYNEAYSGFQVAYAISE